MEQRRFMNRSDAGRQLAEQLGDHGDEDVVVYGLARGGVPVAAEVAKGLSAPLDTIIVRKLGAPTNPELAVGAITSRGGTVLNDSVVRAMGLSEDDIEGIAKREREEITRQETAIRGDGGSVSPEGKVAILVDDGLATGASMRAAVRAIRQERPKSVIVAVPTASREAVNMIEQEADEVVCLMVPASFMAVGQWYEDFGQTPNEEARELLERFGKNA
jgi:putative phosphoribosyl transferase